MAQKPDSNILIIGIGNAYRGDDAAGLLVVRRLAALNTGRFVLEESDGEISTLISLWAKAETVILVDAVCSGSEAGHIFQFDAVAQPLPETLFQFSTHGFGVAHAVELARALNQLPPRLLLYGIEGRNFEHGEAVTPEVEQAINLVVDRILGTE